MHIAQLQKETARVTKPRRVAGVRPLNEIEELIHQLAQYAAVVGTYSTLVHSEAKDPTLLADLSVLKQQSELITELTRKLQRVDWQKSEIVWHPKAPDSGPAKI